VFSKSLPLWGRWLAEGQTDEVRVRVTHSIWNGRHEWRPYGCFAGILPYSGDFAKSLICQNQFAKGEPAILWIAASYCLLPTP
jgi:hypothetical protein